MRGTHDRLSAIITFLFIGLFHFGAFADNAPYKVAKFRYSYEFILQAVADHMGISLRSEVSQPSVYLQSKTPLKQFQDAVEPQWNLRPDVFLNSYIERNNEIYLIDEFEYYDRMKRSIDDSLAHEYVHFLQVHYKGYDLRDDSAEAHAVAVQTWFRENYIKTGKFTGSLQ